jgi:metal-responsive CopG/Arc/MetJ family transcriptional regulator
MHIARKTTKWKNATNQKSINFCIGQSLLAELDGLKRTTGSTRSEMIRTGIRLYIQKRKEQLAESERKELDGHLARQRNQSYRVRTGLLPDY